MHLAMGKGTGETMTMGIAATVPLGESDYWALIAH